MTLVTTDVVMTSGARARMCPHAAESWLVLAALAKARGFGTLRIFQAYGFSILSGNTHAHGTAVDANDSSKAFALLARECGWDASWPRGEAYGQSFAAHCHATIRCPCNPNAARYQTNAVLAGRDGLGKDGRGGADYVAAPSQWRDWQAGLDWARAELQKIQPPPPPPDEEVPTVFLATTAEFDDTAPDKGGSKTCLVVPGKVIWLSPDQLELWLRALPESMTKLKGSPFLWVQLQSLADDMAAGIPNARGFAARGVVQRDVATGLLEGERGATVADFEGLLS